MARPAALLAAALLTAACASCSTPTSGPPADSATGFPAPVTTSSPATPPTAQSAASAPGGPTTLTPVLADVIAVPIPVPATDGRTHLAYELRLTNVLEAPVTLTSVAVAAPDLPPLLTLSGAELTQRTRILGSAAPTDVLGPAQTAVVWLDVQLTGAAPQRISHTVTATLSKPAPPLLPPTVVEQVADIAVSTHKPPVIAPPLRGPGWLDGNSCCDLTAHRTALNPLGGTLWVAERFAIDYVALAPDGTLYRGDRADPNSYPYFGAGVHAVADGPVVAVLDGLPEQVAGRSPTDLPLDQYAGNHVVQDLGDGNYALYAHLQTGSVAVRPGQRLATGTVLGRLGNTGNSDAPHLHFHVMSTPDPLRSDGLPFVLDTFALTGRIATMDSLDGLLAGAPAQLTPGFATRPESAVSPLVLDVMDYPGG